jgi:hypothetical protein
LLLLLLRFKGGVAAGRLCRSLGSTRRHACLW